MKFEYDMAKSILNKFKHGITLGEAQGIWGAPHIQLAARPTNEPRFIIVGNLSEEMKLFGLFQPDGAEYRRRGNIMSKSTKKFTAKEFDQAFEKGDVTEYLDRKSLKVHHPVQRINVDIPKEMLQKVDREAVRIGVARTSLLKMWIAERLQH